MKLIDLAPQEEIFFMAGLASLLPQYIGGRSSSASFGAAASDPIQKFMLVRCLPVVPGVSAWKFLDESPQGI